jgi:S1-C subfamily serine protease
MKLLITLLFLVGILNVNGQKPLINQFSQSIDIGSYAVLVQTSSGSGSGFYLTDTINNFLYFITACHVLVNPQTGKIHSDMINLISYKNNSQRDERDSFAISLQTAINMDMFKFDIKKDVAVLRFATSKNRGISYFSFVFKITQTNTYLHQFGIHDIQKIDSLVTMKDIFTIGYPKSLTFSGNYDFSRPLLRKGIIAGIDLKANKIIVDCPFYQGNSGGAVYTIDLFGTMKLIGVASEFIPLVEYWENKSYAGILNTNIHNSGYSVVAPIDAVIEQINLIK